MVLLAKQAIAKGLYTCFWKWNIIELQDQHQLFHSGPAYNFPGSPCSSQPLTIAAHRISWLKIPSLSSLLHSIIPIDKRCVNQEATTPNHWSSALRLNHQSTHGIRTGKHLKKTWNWRHWHQENRKIHWKKQRRLRNHRHRNLNATFKSHNPPEWSTID